MGGPPWGCPTMRCSALICRYTRLRRGNSVAWVNDLSDRPNCEGQLLLSPVTVLVVCVPGRPLLQPTR